MVFYKNKVDMALIVTQPCIFKALDAEKPSEVG